MAIINNVNQHVTTPSLTSLSGLSTHYEAFLDLVRSLGAKQQLDGGVRPEDSFIQRRT